MRRAQCLVGLLVVVSAVALLQRAEAQDRPETLKAEDKDKASAWMKAKLDYSQKILAGLTRGDFDAVGSNAKAMSVAGFLEKWVKAGNPDYKRQLELFEFANGELIRQAKDKNLDGATLAFNQLTVSCIQCHKLIRSSEK